MRGKSLRQERGVALIMVLSLVALVTTVVADFQYTSRVGYQLAVNARDELQAEYNAMSAMRVRALLLRQAGKLDAQRNMIASMLGVNVAMIPPVGQLLEMLPVECGLMSSIMKLSDGVGGESSDSPGFEGDCLATSNSEHAKVSVNMLRNQLNNRSKKITGMLLGLLREPRLEKHFQEDDRNGTHAEAPEVLVEAIVDWTDANKSQAINGVSDEERHYMNLKDSYKVKNAPFDSLKELQLVHGVDDELFGLLKDHLSIYTDGTQIELATAPLDRIVLIGLPAALREGVVPEQLWYHPRFPEFYVAILELRQLGGLGFGVFNVQVLAELATEYIGDIVDMKQLRTIFTDQANHTWYTIHAEGRVGNVSRHLTGVFQAREGKFYYMRVE